MAKKKMYWFYNPPRQPKPKVPELIKIEVKEAGDKFVESVLKPKFIEPNPQNKRFNYLVDILRSGGATTSIFIQNIVVPAPMP
jgi:hypothetical protein